MDSPFRVWLPATLQKSEGAAGPARLVEGWASTDDEDLHREIVVQEGLDVAPLLQKGFIDWDHMAERCGPEFIIGEPLTVELRSVPGGGTGLLLKGFLYEDHPKADAAWAMLQRQASGASQRQLGFSVDGRVLDQAGRFVKKAMVRHVALTHQPVNTKATAWATFAKSLAGGAAPPEILTGTPQTPGKTPADCAACRAQALVHLTAHRHLDTPDAVARLARWHRTGQF